MLTIATVMGSSTEAKIVECRNQNTYDDQRDQNELLHRELQGDFLQGIMPSAQRWVRELRGEDCYCAQAKNWLEADEGACFECRGWAALAGTTKSRRLSGRVAYLSNQMTTRIAIAVVIDYEDRVLIGRRPEGVPLARLWEFPGGKIEPDETPELAAQRECLEETGLTVAPHRRLLPEVHEYEHGTVELNFVWCLPYGSSFEPRGGFCWVPIAELPHYDFPAGNRRTIELLLNPPDDRDEVAVPPGR